MGGGALALHIFAIARSDASQDGVPHRVGAHGQTSTPIKPVLRLACYEPSQPGAMPRGRAMPYAII